MPRASRRKRAQKAGEELGMPRIVIELIAAIGLTLAAILASATGASASDIMVTEAFARASATPGATAGVAYVSLVNYGGIPDRLVSVTTPVAASAELHRSETVGGMAMMPPAGTIDLPPGGMLTMNPGGMHIMLMGLAAPLKKGDTIELRLVFERAGELILAVPVGGVAAMRQEASGSGG
jgi:copper(I)-binding protein